ncbi:hypothetical protein [Oxalicibacterium solurbis]|uniref:Uncharacterized protein n=1 Tax=Oxalicibacterium solurbis TaxID=69280 RepID=A0A8J3AW43_9BURK|nr:hypothetical protein [Oxalicibacterium solurbis]GGI54385.1 hypothetical protein GCM10011430_15590 [Oxalicibacterium solurbis]
MPVPWTTIIATLPTLIDAAGKLFKKTSAPPPRINPSADHEEKLNAAIKQLEYYESLQAEQSKLLKETIEQLQNVSLSCSTMARRANIAIVLAIVSLLITAGTLLGK